MKVRTAKRGVGKFARPREVYTVWTSEGYSDDLETCMLGRTSGQVCGCISLFLFCLRLIYFVVS
jgi:hypothetical protein